MNTTNLLLAQRALKALDTTKIVEAVEGIKSLNIPEVLERLNGVIGLDVVEIANAVNDLRGLKSLETSVRNAIHVITASRIEVAAGTLEVFRSLELSLAAIVTQIPPHLLARREQDY